MNFGSSSRSAQPKNGPAANKGTMTERLTTISQPLLDMVRERAAEAVAKQVTAALAGPQSEVGAVQLQLNHLKVQVEGLQNTALLVQPRLEAL